MRILSLDGKELQSPVNAQTKTTGSYQLKLNLADFPPGIYFFELSNNVGGKITKKGIKVR